MGLLSMFQSKPQGGAKAAAGLSGDAVQQLRVRARRRLIGALVLVLIGIVGFPLLFETQPRPIPVDIPIEIPRKEGALPLAMPAARPKAPLGAAPAEAASATEAVAAPRVETVPQTPPASKPVEVPPPPPVVAAPEPVPPSDDGARAKALLEGKPAVSKTRPKDVAEQDGARYVVQVGAFADAAAARETRLKVEKLGLKTYTQVAQTSSGSRIRVRVGPFSSRDEADRALAKAKAAGMPAVVLTL